MPRLLSGRSAAWISRLWTLTRKQAIHRNLPSFVYPSNDIQIFIGTACYFKTWLRRIASVEGPVWINLNPFHIATCSYLDAIFKNSSRFLEACWDFIFALISVQTVPENPSPIKKEVDPRREVRIFFIAVQLRTLSADFFASCNVHERWNGKFFREEFLSLHHSQFHYVILNFYPTNQHSFKVIIHDTSYAPLPSQNPATYLLSSQILINLVLNPSPLYFSHFSVVGALL